MADLFDIFDPLSNPLFDFGNAFGTSSSSSDSAANNQITDSFDPTDYGPPALAPRIWRAPSPGRSLSPPARPSGTGGRLKRMRDLENALAERAKNKKLKNMESWERIRMTLEDKRMFTKRDLYHRTDLTDW